MSNVYVKDQEPQSFFKFPSGEVGVRVETYPSKKATIVAHINNSDDIMYLLLLNDSLKRRGKENITLILPYIPYSRQDRVCNPGEALSIKVFADMVNMCGFHKVVVLDPHSDVAPALINNVKIIHQSQVFNFVTEDWQNTIIISPDAGALKKAEKFAKDRNVKGVVVANKKRNVLTGEIEYVRLTESVEGEHVFVVDDLCEGGGTFLLLAEQLHGVLSKKLAVTHGIFSKGTKLLTDVYDTVYTTNSYHKDLQTQGNLVVQTI